MPIDPSKVRWDDDVIDPSKVQWDDAPASPSSGGFLSGLMSGVTDASRLATGQPLSNATPVGAGLNDVPRGAARGAVHGLGDLAKYTVGLPALGLATIGEGAYNMLPGDDTHALTDWVAGNVVRPLDTYPESVDQALPYQTPVGPVAQQATEVGTTLASALLGGEAWAAAKLAKPAQGIGEYLLNAGKNALRTSAIPAEVAAGKQTQDVLNRGGTLPQAFASGAAAGLATPLEFVMPLSFEGGLLKRMLSGGAVSPVLTQFDQAARNAPLPDDLKQELSPGDYGRSAMLDTAMAALLGPRAAGTSRTKSDPVREVRAAAKKAGFTDADIEAAEAPTAEQRSALTPDMQQMRAELDDLLAGRGEVPEVVHAKDSAATPETDAAQSERATAPLPDGRMHANEGWVIRNKETGEPVMETHNERAVQSLNKAKYEAVPVSQHLAELNQPGAAAFRHARGEATSERASTESEPLESQSPIKSVQANIRRGREAMARALTEKADQHRAMYRPGMGWVDFVWGDDGTPTGLAGTNLPGKRVLSGKGLAHLIGQRMRNDGLSRQDAERVAGQMVDAIASGKEVSRHEVNGNTTVTIDHGNHQAMLVRGKGSNTWLLTGWQKKAPDSTAAGYVAGGDTLARTSPTRPDEGAGASESLPRRAPGSNEPRDFRDRPDGEVREEDLTPDERAWVARVREDSAKAGREAEADAAERELGEQMRQENAAQGEREADQLGMKRVADAMFPDQQVTFVHDEDGVDPAVRARLRPLKRGHVRKGFYDPKAGHTYILTKHTRTPGEAAWTVAHEVGGHKAFRSWIEKHADTKVGGRTAREALHAATELARQNATVAKLADVIQRGRGETRRGVDVEEALAELQAASLTGDFDRIQSRYGVEVPEAMRPSLKRSLANYVRRITRILNAIFKRETGHDGTFTDEDVRDMLADTLTALDGRVNRTEKASRESLDSSENSSKPSSERDTNVRVATDSNIAGKQGARAAGDESRREVDEATGLPLNGDGTVTVYHHTSRANADAIRRTGTLRAAAEPDVYVTTNRGTDTGYGDTALPIRVDPSRLEIDDEFPNGRRDFRLHVGRPGGSIKVDVANDSGAPDRSGARDEPLNSDEPAPEAGADAAHLADARRVPDEAEHERAGDGELDSAGPTNADLFDKPFPIKRGKLDSARYQLQDKFIDLQRIQEGVEASTRRVLDDAENVKQAAELFTSKAAAQIEDFRENVEKPIVDFMHKGGLDVREVDDWLMARHAAERNRRMQDINPGVKTGSGMSDAQANAMLAKYRNNETMQRIGKIVDWMVSKNRQMMVGSGLVPADAVAAWSKMYEHYVPLKGFDDAEKVANRVQPSGRGFDVRGKVKQAFGRDSRAASPLANLLADYERTIVQANKAEVGRTLYRLAQSNPNSALWELNKVPQTPRIDKKTGLVTYGPDPMYKFADNVINVKIDGVDHTITMHGEQGERFAKAFKNLSTEMQSGMIRGLSRVNRYLAAVNTSLNPEFMLSNFARDVQEAFVNMAGTEVAAMRAKVVRDIPKAMKGLREVLRKGEANGEWAKYTKDFRQDGGMTMWMDAHHDVDKLTRSLSGQLRSLKRGKLHPANVFSTAGKLIEDYNKIVENGVRLSAYVHARKAGLSRVKAAHLAKDLTVNFDRKGQLGPVINAMYLFYNASIQGNARVLRALKHPKVRKTVYGIIAASAVMSVANRMVGGTDEDGIPYYDKIPNHEKESNLIFMLPPDVDLPDWMESRQGGGKYIKIILPYGYNVFKVFGDKVGDGLSAALGYKKKFEPMQGAMATMDAFIGSFNPLGSSPFEVPAQAVSPSLLDPAVQVWTNKTWYGAPMYPAENPFDRAPKPDSQLYWNSTSQASRKLASLLNAGSGGDSVVPGWVDVSPITLDLLWNTLTGGTGATALRGTKVVGKAITGEDLEPREVPFVRRVVGAVNARQFDREQFYDNLTRIAQAKKELDAAITPAQRKRRVDEWGEYLRMRPMARGSERELRALRKQKDRIDAMSLSAREKSERKEAIDKRMGVVYRRLNMTLEKALEARQ